jgi:hypothetical protein
MLEQIIKDMQENPDISPSLKEQLSGGLEAYLDNLAWAIEKYSEQVSEKNSAEISNMNVIYRFLSGQDSTAEVDSLRKQLYEDLAGFLQGLPEVCRDEVSSLLESNSS